MSASKVIRESRKLLEPLGYELVGWNQSSHLVYRHPTGAVARVVATFDTNPRSRANMVNQARRNIREIDSVSRLWVNFVREQYEVGVDEEKLCVISMTSLVKRFKARHPGLRFSDKLPGVALRQSPYVDHVKKGVYIVRGELFGVTPAEEADDVPVVESARELDPVPVVAAGGVAADEPGGGSPAGGEAEQSEPRDDPESPESTRPDRKLSGEVVIPPGLADILRKTLGTDGDLQAENALLREAVDEAVGCFQRGAQVLQAALSLHPQTPPDKSRLGPKRMRQLHMLRHAISTMPEQFTAETIEPMLGVGHDEALNILAGLTVNGHTRRLARGVYEWVQR